MIFFFVNQLQATWVSCQSVSGKLSPSINVTHENNAVIDSNVKYGDYVTLQFFVS